MEEERIPGLAIAISKNNEVVYAKGFGVQDVESGDSVTAETIFGTASITKSFTAATILSLERKGLLSVEDPVQQHLPQFQLRDYDNIEAIQIHHLLSHTTGIPTIARKEELTTFQEHFDYLKQLKLTPLGKPGEYFCYNNDMFLLLGAIIEKVTGRNYKDVIREEIIQLNQMARTVFEIKELEALENVSTPYTFENEQLIQTEWPTLGNYAVGGGVRSTVLDLLKYGEMYLKDSKLMRKQVHRTHGKCTYGYGLQFTPDYHGVTLIEHGGSQPGVSSNFGFIPEENIVIALLTNMSDVSASDIWLYAANHLLALDLETKRQVAQLYEMPSTQLLKFTGVYRTGEGSVIEIIVENNQLQAIIDGKSHGLRASGPETFVVVKDDNPIRFYLNKKNMAWALFIGLRMFVKEKE